jgi:hypothetical protein
MMTITRESLMVLPNYVPSSIYDKFKSQHAYIALEEMGLDDIGDFLPSDCTM